MDLNHIKLLHLHPSLREVVRQVYRKRDVVRLQERVVGREMAMKINISNLISMRVLVVTNTKR